MFDRPFHMLSICVYFKVCTHWLESQFCACQSQACKRSITIALYWVHSGISDSDIWMQHYSSYDWKVADRMLQFLTLWDTLWVIPFSGTYWSLFLAVMKWVLKAAKSYVGKEKICTSPSLTWFLSITDNITEAGAFLKVFIMHVFFFEGPFLYYSCFVCEKQAAIVQMSTQWAMKISSKVAIANQILWRNWLGYKKCRISALSTEVTFSLRGNSNMFTTVAIYIFRISN